jgi:hypothetical protein
MASFRFASSNRDPRRFDWLIEILSKDPLEEGSTSLSKMKNLMYLSPFLCEFSWKGLSLQRNLLKMLTEENVLKNQYKQVRVAVSEVISTSLSSCERNEKIDEISIKYIKNMLELCQKEKVENTILFTAINFIHYTAKERNRSKLLIPFFSLATNIVLHAHLNEDKDIQQLAKVTSALLAQINIDKSVFFDQVFPTLKMISSSPFWHLRSASLPFLQIIVI